MTDVSTMSIILSTHQGVCVAVSKNDVIHLTLDLKTSFLSVVELCAVIDTERVLDDSSFKRAATADRQTEKHHDRQRGWQACW